MTEHIIDCDAVPYIPESLRYLVEDQLPNRVGGLFVWDPTRVTLFHPQFHFEEFEDSWFGSKEQLASLSRSFEDVVRQLEGKKVLPAQVLEYLLKNTQLIPGAWIRDQVGFYGSIYRSRQYGLKRVRTIAWNWSGAYWSSSEGFGDAVLVVAD
jgi:hypothetical protein